MELLQLQTPRARPRLLQKHPPHRLSACRSRPLPAADLVPVSVIVVMKAMDWLGLGPNASKREYIPTARLCKLNSRIIVSTVTPGWWSRFGLSIPKITPLDRPILIHYNIHEPNRLLLRCPRNRIGRPHTSEISNLDRGFNQ